MMGARPIDSPMDPNIQFSRDDGEVFNDPSRY